MSLAILFHFLCAQHVSDINISIIRSLRLCCWITTSVVLFSVRCVLEIWCGWYLVVFVLQAEAQLCFSLHQSSNTQRTENKTTDVVIHQHSRKLLMMDILMSETCWAHKKWNKIATDINLVQILFPSRRTRHFSINTTYWVLHWTLSNACSAPILTSPVELFLFLPLDGSHSYSGILGITADRSGRRSKAWVCTRSLRGIIISG